MKIELKFDAARQHYVSIALTELEDRNLPDVFINVFRKKSMIQCQTLDLVKWNQKIVDSHHEVVKMSDRVIQELIDNIRQDVAPLFRASEGIAILDMIASFAQLVTTQDYCRPELTPTLAIKNGRHPIREKIHDDKFVPNDVYAREQSRLQIISGCNMSGKSTYIRSIALMTVMAQIGSFVPATYASFPIRHQLFARVSQDDSIESNVSTFAAEMRETAFILRNVDDRSMVIIDELGRGTSTRDGLAIAIAVAEALVESKALVWFVTHFRDLARFLSERAGVVNLHLAVKIDEANRIMMLYKIADGFIKEEHYGLALAKVVALPPKVIVVAEEASAVMTRSREGKKKQSKIIVQARKRKIFLGLREQLMQAREGNMQGEVLRCWLKKLQDEFVIRMDRLDQEERIAEDEHHELGEEMSASVLEPEQTPPIADAKRSGASPSDGDDDCGTESSNRVRRIPNSNSQDENVLGDRREVLALKNIEEIPQAKAPSIKHYTIGTRFDSFGQQRPVVIEYEDEVESSDSSLEIGKSVTTDMESIDTTRNRGAWMSGALQGQPLPLSGCSDGTGEL